MENQVGKIDFVESGRNRSNSIAIMAIIAVAAIILTCILACSATAIIFIYNVNW